MSLLATNSERVPQLVAIVASNISRATTFVWTRPSATHPALAGRHALMQMALSPMTAAISLTLVQAATTSMTDSILTMWFVHMIAYSMWV